VVDVNTIRTDEKALATLRTQLEKQVKKSWGKNKTKRLEEQVKLLNKKQFHVMAEYLHSNNTKIRQLIDMNRTMLVREEMKMKVSKTGMAMTGSYTKEFKGTIRKNGWLYADATNVSWDFMDSFEHLPAFFGFKVFPKAYRGTINFMGQIELTVTKHGYYLLGSRLPTHFKASIDGAGNVNMELNKSEWEVGNQFAHRLIADPFKGDDGKRMVFIRNKTEIQNAIHEARKDLL